MKHWLRVLVSVALALPNAVPVWAGSGGHVWSPPADFRGFVSHTPLSVDAPTMKPPAPPGTSVAPQRMGPSATASGAASVSDHGSREEITPRIRSVHIDAVEPKMIMVDPSSRSHIVTSVGSGTTARPGSPASGPRVIAVNAPVGSRPVVPKIIEVSPALLSRPLTAKVTVVTPSLRSRHRGRTVIGISEGPQGASLLLGSSCDFGLNVPESCTPVDSALLIVEAAPADAQVFLDGQFLGTAHQLAGQTVAVPAGPHGLKIVSPGAEPFSAQFTATPDILTRIHVALATQ